MEEDKRRIEEKVALIERERLKVVRALSLGAAATLSPGLIKALEEEAVQDIGLILAGLSQSAEPKSDQVSAIFDRRKQALEKELGTLGGSTRAQTIQVLERLDLQAYWFRDAFDETEGILLQEYFLRGAPGRPETWKGLDIGSGVGRASLLTLQAMQREFGEQAAVKFAHNLHAVDLMPRFVAATQETLASHGVPEHQVVQGDFLALPQDLLQGQFNFVWALMHTLFHCTTENDLKLAMQNIEAAMARGGRLIIDSVGLFYHQGIPPQDNVRDFDDLKNLYDALVRKYFEEKIEPRLELRPAPSFRMARFPTEDATGQVGFYPREVLTINYLERVLKKMNSRLRRMIDPETHEPFSQYRRNSVVPRERAERLGMQWIDENGLRDWMKREVAYRLEQKERKAEVIRPFYSLSREEREGHEFTNLAHAKIDEILKDLARAMVIGYIQRYWIFEKK